jgi:hypothetical protein
MGAGDPSKTTLMEALACGRYRGHHALSRREGVVSRRRRASLRTGLSSRWELLEIRDGERPLFNT